MADIAGATPTQAPQRATMTITAGQGATAGSGAIIIAWLWNTFATKRWGVEPMSVETAVALGIVLTPVVHYMIGWLPMPPVRNRRM